MTSRAIGAVSRAIASKVPLIAPLSRRILVAQRQAIARGGGRSTGESSHPSSLRHRRRPRRNRIADTGAGAVGLRNQVGAGKIERQHGMLDDFERPVGFESTNDLWRKPPV